jgi:hypothetical protein
MQGNSDEPVTLRLDQLAPLSNLQVAGGRRSALLFLSSTHPLPCLTHGLCID